MGAPADVLARMGGGDEEPAAEDDVEEIEVLECNWNAVAVFLHCEPQWLGGMSACRLGIAAAEIRAAVLLLRIPRAEWPQLFADVRFMGRIAAQVENEQLRKK